MSDWSRVEAEAIVADYFEMLASELARVPYNKTSHRDRLAVKLDGRSKGSIEFKHCNISAILIDLRFPYVAGYKPRSNYQALLFDVVAERLAADKRLQALAEADVESPIVAPELSDILKVLENPPERALAARGVSEPARRRAPFFIDYLEREARNRSLGGAGEQFVIEFERARLINAGRERLADRIVHTSLVHGDAEGFDVLSYEESGAERLIEVKTTKYGAQTPFFASSNEVAVSAARSDLYCVYRLFQFQTAPRMFTLRGAISATCELSAATYTARVR